MKKIILKSANFKNSAFSQKESKFLSQFRSSLGTREHSIGDNLIETSFIKNLYRFKCRAVWGTYFFKGEFNVLAAFFKSHDSPRHRLNNKFRRGFP